VIGARTVEPEHELDLGLLRWLTTTNHKDIGSSTSGHRSSSSSSAGSNRS